jgi:hypothetical protein
MQRFRRAMVNDYRMPLGGRVEADETLIGGPAKGKKGRGVAKGQSKSLVLGMVEVLSYTDASGTAKNRAGRVRLEGVDHADEETIRVFLGKNLTPGSTVQTDGWRGDSDTALLDYRPIVKVQDSPQSASRLAPHIHRVFSNLKPGSREPITGWRQNICTPTWTNSSSDSTGDKRQWRHFKLCSG